MEKNETLQFRSSLLEIERKQREVEKPKALQGIKQLYFQKLCELQGNRYYPLALERFRKDLIENE